MKAIVLAAGKSTRLHPLTLSLPKCLLPVGNATILDHQIESLIEAGVSELIIVVGFEKEQIINHIANKKYPLNITFVENTRYENSHPITSLYFAKAFIEGPLIFFHCDVLFTADVVKALLTDPSESVLPYRENTWDAEAGKIIVDSDGRVRELGKHIEERRSTGEYLQIAKFGPDFCKRLATVLNERTRAERDGYTIDAFNDVVQDDTIRAIGLPFKGFAVEIDTKEDYVAAQRAWDKKNS